MAGAPTLALAPAKPLQHSWNRHIRRADSAAGTRLLKMTQRPGTNVSEYSIRAAVPEHDVDNGPPVEYRILLKRDLAIAIANENPFGHAEMRGQCRVFAP
jgi:hypothetical protein